MPQHPGVEFQSNGVELTGEASETDSAIRASLIWFKHQFPGHAAVVTGPDDFRAKVWLLADELGVPLHGPRPGSQSVAVYGGAPTQPKR
jgi:hypothetical protein